MRYYKNGSHTAVILHMTDAAQKQKDVDALRQALPHNTGGFGDAAKAAAVFARNELKPQDWLLGVNDWLGIAVVRFDAYKLEEAAA